MKLVELSMNDFDEFARNHPLRNFCQSSTYAKFVAEQGFSYDFVGYMDNDQLIGASLIIYKRITALAKYAYAPKGFLIDYYNTELFERFTEEVTKKYKSKGVVFIKINPEIIIGELNPKKSFAGEYNQNYKIIDDLKNLKYKRRREVRPLELVAPRVSPYVNLKKYDEAKLSKDFGQYVALSKNKGLEFEIGQAKNINELYEFVKNDASHPINYYRNMYNVFEKNGMAEIILVKLNYKETLKKAREYHDIEQERNNYFNELIKQDASEENLNDKMNSDKLLLELMQNINEATEGLKRREAQYIAGALVVKYLNRVSIIISGLDDYFANLFPKHFLYSKMIEYYQRDFDYLDLNGFVEDAEEGTPHYENNEFKLGFKPNLYEFIGEFDIIMDEFKFRGLQAKDLVAAEFKGQKLS